MDRPSSTQWFAEELVDRVMRQEMEVLAEVRAMLHAHRERRLELRRELHALMGQFGELPQPNNVTHLRLVHGGLDDDGSEPPICA